MLAKIALLFCAQALFIQSISGQCIGAGYPLATAPLAAPPAAPLGCGCGAFPAAALAASNGPGLAVTSVSPIVPVGVSVTSENAYEGGLAVAGALPFISAVALEGALPTIGAGVVSYGCGRNEVAILTEDLGGPLDYYGGPLGYGPGPVGYEGPLGYANAPLGPLAGPYGGCGCGYGAYI